MTRIIAGKFKGQQIAVPKSGVRPTTDRVRESIFSAIDARLDSWHEIEVLDVFAGSGGLGIEALSRGAKSATFVEKDRFTAANIEANLSKLGAVGDVINLEGIKYLPTKSFNLVFLDPPFAIADQYLKDLLVKLAPHISIGGMVLVERGRDHDFQWPIGYSTILYRSYGDSLIFLAERQDAI